MAEGEADFYGLPSVQVRTVLSENVPYTSVSGCMLLNRIPEGGEDEVPHLTLGERTRIALQVALINGVPSLHNLRVEVDQIPVVVGGVVTHPAWSGTVHELGEAVLAVSIARATAFESAHRSTVRVLYSNKIVDTYSFTWRDELPPEVEDVVAEDVFGVRVTFDEPVDPLTAHEPLRYRLERVSKFAAVPAVRSAAAGLSDSEVYLTFAQPLTFGAVYTLHTPGVGDRYGNVVAEDAEGVTFVAHSPPVPEGRRFQLWDFVPELHKRSDAETGELYAFVSILQEPTNVLLWEIDRFETLADGDLAPEPFVDAMLADFGCPFDISQLDLGEKRKLLRLLIGIYQKKGTTEGLISAALTLFGLTIEVHPLNEGGWQLGVHELGNEATTWLGPESSFQRFAFEVTVYLPEDHTFDARQRAQLVELIHVMRPAHTHFRRLNEVVLAEA